MAAESKAKKDKAGQRTAQDRIRVIQQGLCSALYLAGHCKLEKVLPWICFSIAFVYFTEMKYLESHPMFNSATKVKDPPKEEKKPVTLTDGKEELNFNLFEQADTPPAEKGEIIFYIIYPFLFHLVWFALIYFLMMLIFSLIFMFLYVVISFRQLLYSANFMFFILWYVIIYIQWVRKVFRPP